MRQMLILLTLALLLTGCTTPSTYSSQEAKRNGDIVVGPGGPLNTDKIIPFITNVDNGQESHLRITSYTDEGDPIISDLHYDGKKIKYSYDTSRDEFGGTSRGKSNTTCEKILSRDVVREDKAIGMQYVLAGCKKIIGPHESGKKEIHLLFVEK
ncbi:DUF4362 domain-containing protein [Paenibacillus mendelii]|uniref:DUF4362 domain-containing protein n=1 Tax=Paenibacillus mendelii TaxID=206163 RepID=A0ABV6JC56_9BACL|nr:DUF4362 domain-containing protein [Paenibacillus mendelii]MCQ6561495.1 DUF4362 domain-containing protein [Paenibacillus mendelii]